MTDPLTKEQEALKRPPPKRCGLCGRFLRKTTDGDWLNNLDAEWVCPAMSYDHYSGAWEHD